MSPALKAAVPPGCLGFDRISRKVDKAALEDDKKVARAWKMEGLNSAADALLGASKKLGAEVEKETKYWEGVLAIRNDGWLITRMPRERNVLGVRYGFAEAAREYKDKGIGALRRNDDGTVRMDDVDTTGARGRAMLRVRIVRNDEVVGTSTQRAGKNDGSVRDMIRRARNFIYEDELFFEIMKEARLFAGQGMRTSEDAAMIELGEGKMVVLDMACLHLPHSYCNLLTIPRLRSMMTQPLLHPQTLSTTWHNPSRSPSASSSPTTTASPYSTAPNLRSRCQAARQSCHPSSSSGR